MGKTQNKGYAPLKVIQGHRSRYQSEMYQVLWPQVRVQVQVLRPQVQVRVQVPMLQVQVQVQVPCVHCKYALSLQLPM